MKHIWPLFALLCLLGSQAGADETVGISAKQLQRARLTIDEMKEAAPELQAYIDNARGYAVFPRIFRAGYLWGGSYGRGLVFAEQELVSRCNQYGFSLGLQLGAQTYKQIILFQTDEALNTFKEGRFEFEGRASVAVITLGANADPAFLPDVAIVSLTEAGLMAEATANGVTYSCKPATER